jgi:Fe-S oxidoreductase
MQVLQHVFFAAVLVAALWSFFVRSKRLITILERTGKPVTRTDQPERRFRQVLRIAFGQTKLLREPFAGLLHVLIFWGFLVLLSAIGESIGEGLIPGFSLSVLGPLFGPLTFLQDLVGACVIASVAVSVFRRLVVPPKRLQVEGHAKQDALTILSLIFIVMLTMFGQNASRIALGAEPAGSMRLLSGYLAITLRGMDASSLGILYAVMFWGHMLVVLFFLNYLPSSKHLHVLTSIPNVYLGNLEPKGAIKPINLADESLTTFGATDVSDLTWKQLLDGFTCTECGRCTSVCPANTTGKLLNPKKIITDVRARTFELAQGTQETADHRLLDNFITDQELWACTTCMACMQECPVSIEHLDTIVDLRKGLVLDESRFPDELKATFSNLERNYTPWGFSHSTRADWAKGLGIPVLSEKGTSEYLFWVGCAGSYDSRYQSVSRAFATLLAKAGVDFAILGNEEKCNGDPARRMGNEYLAQSLMTENIATMERYGVKKILVTCPHCMQSIGKEYRQFGAQYEVIHHSVFLKQLVDAGRLKLRAGAQGTVTFHDPCYLGRYNDEYDAPRDMIALATGTQPVEMDRSHSRSFCCGAGGGRMWMEEREGTRVNMERTDQALAVSPDVIGTGCPFCLTMLTDGVKEREAAERVKVKDIAELVLESLVDG